MRWSGTLLTLVTFISLSCQFVSWLTFLCHHFMLEMNRQFSRKIHIRTWLKVCFLFTETWSSQPVWTTPRLVYFTKRNFSEPTRRSDLNLLEVICTWLCLWFFMKPKQPFVRSSQNLEGILLSSVEIYYVWLVYVAPEHVYTQHLFFSV